MKLLVIEDDPNVSDAVCAAVGERFETEQAFDGEEGLYLAEQGIYDIIILDIMLPLLDGYGVLRKLREKGSNAPVLLLTAKDGLDDKIRGFRIGADDYLVKPFHREELLLRLEAILRRGSGTLQDQILHFRELSLKLHNRTTEVAGEQLELQGKQFDMMEYLVRNQNIIVTKEQMFDRIWGFDSETTANVVEVYASNLRKSLKKCGYDRYIKTVRGMGYMLTDNGEDDG